MSTERKGLRRIDVNRVQLNPMSQEKIHSKAPTKHATVLQKPTRKGSLVYRKTRPSTTLQDLFQDDETPIRRLPYDCLLTIFKYCQGTSTLIALSGVNRSWRKLAQNPILWKDSSFLWSIFQKTLSFLCRSPRRNSPFQYVRTLTITSSSDLRLRCDTYEIEQTPFAKVETLNTNQMTLCDIASITAWMPNITSLHCHDIAVHKRESIPKFTKLAKLNSLKLKFSKPYSLNVPRFGSTQASTIFPSSLRRLEISNLFDEEEHMITQKDIRDVIEFRQTGFWIREISPEQIENTLHVVENSVARKYYIFCSLINLTSLSLDRISSFTTAVWSKYMSHCSKNLTYISLKGWKGRRESLDHVFTDDVGLVRFISSLSRIEIMVLDDFLCTQDFILGLQKLTEPTHITYQTEDDTNILNHLDKPLYNFRIFISRK